MVSKSISSKHIVKTSPVEVSILSTLPPGLDEGQYVPADFSEEEIATSGPGEVVTPVEETTPDDGDTGGLPREGDGSLAVPTNIRVKSQRFWFGDGGIPFVDVILEADNVAGAHEFEVRFVEA